MKRRDFIATGASLLIAGPVFAGGGLRYKKGLVDEQLAAGKTVFVDFYTAVSYTHLTLPTKIV